MSICAADFEDKGQLKLPFTEKQKKLNNFRLYKNSSEQAYINEEFNYISDMVKSGEISSMVVCGKTKDGSMLETIICFNDDKLCPFEMIGGLEALKQRIMMERIDWNY